MSPPLFLFAACAAVFLALNPEASVHAFNLQLKAGRAVGLPSLVSPSTDLFKGPTTAPGAPLATAGPPALPASELRLHAAASSPAGEGAPSSGADNSVLAMAAFLRCHKPLLNDRGPELPDGNLCMLLRGCDAHQRMISPLELKTNGESLPGATAAGMMAAKGIPAAEALCEQLGESLKLTKGPHGVCPVELLKLEVGKVHRLLQFATAAGLKKNFLNSDALLVMLELYEVHPNGDAGRIHPQAVQQLYVHPVASGLRTHRLLLFSGILVQEVGLNSDHIVHVIKGLKDFYQARLLLLQLLLQEEELQLLLVLLLVPVDCEGVLG